MKVFAAGVKADTFFRTKTYWQDKDCNALEYFCFVLNSILACVLNYSVIQVCIRVGGWEEVPSNL